MIDWLILILNNEINYIIEYKILWLAKFPFQLLNWIATHNDINIYIHESIIYIYIYYIIAYI